MPCDFRRAALASEAATAPSMRFLMVASASMNLNTVEPEPTPVEPVEELVQKNDAVALLDQTILAAPRFYDPASDAQVEASLRRYELTSGLPTGAVDLTGRGLDVAGMTTTNDAILAVSDGALVRFDRQGRLETEQDLDVTDPAGIAVDGDGDVLVLDRNARAVKRVR